MGRTAMSVKELRRVEVLGRVKAKTLSLRSAATMLGLSYRQTKRVWRRFRRRGARGLQHQSAGRSNRQITAATRKRALALIRQKYSGPAGTRFGPTLAAEHLASEDDVHIDHETLRRWMLAAGLWSPTRRRSPYRQRRERKAHFGELVQFDGSFHLWYEDRGPHRCLITMVDDATSTMIRPLQRPGNHLGRCGGVADVDRGVWRAAGALHRLEERLCAGRHRRGDRRRGGAADAVWSDVRGARDADYSGQFSAGQRPRGA